MSRNDKDLFELEELAVQPGTYFNPQTEVVVIVDDSFAVDPEDFDAEDDDADWYRISDEIPINEQARDELFEEYRARRQPEETDEDFTELDDDLEPDEDPGDEE